MPRRSFIALGRKPAFSNFPEGLLAMLSFTNPDSVHAPLGLYSHTVKVPDGTSLLFVSGQIGVRKDGTTPSTIGEQADQVFGNIISLLNAHGLAASDIVKLTTFMVHGHDGQAVRNARLKYLGDHRPPSTVVYVSQLVDPAWFVEAEAVAAKSAA
jgi:2-iminobutanoate/2-iminopropanoate deaminase